GWWGWSFFSPYLIFGFLFTHFFSFLLPLGGGAYRYSNSDPITGQAAWFDLRVSIEKAEQVETGETQPRFEATATGGLPRSPKVVAYGAQFREAAR
ncbi:MAG: hypothetical protein ACFB0F_01110, partial [Neomegalonema sp.]